MKVTLAFGVAGNQGNWPAQEDGYLVDPQARIFGVADGFGGPGNGDIAAKLALKELGARLSRKDHSAVGAVEQRALFADINKNILEWNGKRPPASRGGCSLGLVQISAAGLVSAINCGATSLGLVRNGVCQAILSPQAAPRMQAGAALLALEALGLRAEIFPEVRSFQSLPGDLLFLASGGLEWESAAFQSELLGQWGVHLPGSVISDLAKNLVERVSPEWNATFLGLEIS